MPLKKHPSRRQFVITSTEASLALVAGTLPACTSDSAVDRRLQFRSLAEAAAEVERLATAGDRQSSAAWTWPQTLNHCAQSIEYSMSGFPQPKSEVFQHTVGSAAIAVFSWRGRMTHDLSEPIPGAPALDPKAEAAPALERLRASMRAFSAWTGALKPHFAYGSLDKQAYEQAHAMHLANHLSAFRTDGSNAG